MPFQSRQFALPRTTVIPSPRSTLAVRSTLASVMGGSSYDPTANLIASGWQLDRTLVGQPDLHQKARPARVGAKVLEPVSHFRQHDPRVVQLIGAFEPAERL